MLSLPLLVLSHQGVEWMKHLKSYHLRGGG